MNPCLPSTNAASGRLFTLDTESAVAKPVGDATLALPMVETGFDFNPTVDRMRVALADGTNMRAHPVTGAQVDSDAKTDGVQRDGAGAATRARICSG